MKRHVPGSDTAVFTSAYQLSARRINPQHTIDAARSRVLDGYIAQGVLDTPNVDVSVKRARSTMKTVCMPVE